MSDNSESVQATMQKEKEKAFAEAKKNNANLTEEEFLASDEGKKYKDVQSYQTAQIDEKIDQQRNEKSKNVQDVFESDKLKDLKRVK